MPGTATLRRIERPPTLPQGRVALIDVEMTGLDPSTDHIIEFAAAVHAYDPADGRLDQRLRHGSWLEDPGVPLNETVINITGIRPSMVAGRRIPDAQVQALLNGVDLIVAHHRELDRPFCVRRMPWIADFEWGCSLTEVPWIERGFVSTALSRLALAHDHYASPHRALADVDTLALVLGADPRGDRPEHRRPYLGDILAALGRLPATV